MKNIEVFNEDKWIKSSINFLDLGINVICPKQNKTILYNDIKSVSSCNKTLKIIYTKKIGIEKSDNELIIKVNEEEFEEFKKRFTIEREKKEKIMEKTVINQEKIIETSPLLKTMKIISLVLCILFIIFSFNINKDNKVLGVYITGNKIAPYLVSLFFGIIFILLVFFEKNKK